MRLRFAWLLVIALGACGAAPRPASPAFWQIEGKNGERAWLLGTIHALDAPARWRSPAIDRALAASDRIVVEVAAVRDDAAMAREFLRTSRSAGHPPLSGRIARKLRPALLRQLAKAGMRDSQFAEIETWAAALMLARGARSNLSSEYGIDKAVLNAAPGKKVEELEGIGRQFAMFDTLPEKEQRDLLVAVVRDGDNGAGGALAADGEKLARAWQRGDLRTIEAETRRGMLADPELREVMFAARNRAWAVRLEATLRGGGKPFVAVGAAHMVGREGLPALLAARGFKVRRVQ